VVDAFIALLRVLRRQTPMSSSDEGAQDHVVPLLRPQKTPA
jgi:hypothetical protein